MLQLFFVRWLRIPTILYLFVQDFASYYELQRTILINYNSETSMYGLSLSKIFCYLCLKDRLHYNRSVACSSLNLQCLSLYLNSFITSLCDSFKVSWIILPIVVFTFLFILLTEFFRFTVFRGNACSVYPTLNIQHLNIACIRGGGAIYIQNRSTLPCWVRRSSVLNVSEVDAWFYINAGQNSIASRAVSFAQRQWIIVLK